MTTRILKFNLLFSLMIWALHLQATNPKYAEKRKQIEKNFDVKTDVILKIENQFGDIHVESWEKNEIDIKVEVIARSKNDERATKMMDKIEIGISQSPSMIVFATELGNINNQGDEENFEINYRVRMNPKNPIRFENRFGDIYLPFRTGESEILIQYGNMKSDGMDAFIQFELAFGNADFGPLNGAEMYIQYSNLNLSTIIELELQQKFSNVQIEKVETLELEAKYGEIELGEVNSAEVEGHFSSFSIDKLKNSLVFEGNYVSGFEISELSRDFVLLDLSGQFTSYKVGLESGLSANIEAEFSYSQLNFSGLDIDFYYQDFEENKKEYKGKINGGSSKRTIIVNSSYGDLRLTQ